MTQRMRNRLIELCLLFALAAAGAAVMPRAHAAMIGTDEAQGTNAAQPERERVKALLERPEVAKKLAGLGVAASDAAARVDAMTDAEVIQLAGKIDSLVAGGAAFTNEQLIVILLLVILLVILL